MPKSTIIVDIDGTMANCDHRQELAETGQWEDFHGRCDQDTPYPDIITIVNTFSSAGFTVFACTGRNERHRPKTLEWLRKHQASVDDIWMRADDDFGKDVEIKIALMEKHFGSKEAVLENVLCVLEDRDKLVVGLRDYGLTVLQVREGKF